MRLIAALAAVLSLVAPVLASEPDIFLAETAPYRFRVEYRLSEPARALYFVRNADDFRTLRWRSSDPVIFHKADGQTRVERRDGAAFVSIAFELDGRIYDDIARDYAPFSPFSDGGVLIHTGHLHACADAPCGADAAWAIVAEPARRRRVAVGETEARGALAFIDRADGSFVYMGAKRPTDIGGIRAVFDDAAPDSVRRALKTSASDLLTWFDAAFGASAARPTFYISAGPAPEGLGFESRGAALNHQISIHLIGGGWRAHLSPERGFLPWYFAHEIAHTRQDVEDRPITDAFMRDAWVQEGGAEALAALAVRAVDPGLSGYVEARIARAVDDCANAMSAPAATRPDPSYACGLAVQMAIDADLRRQTDGARTLVDVWRLFLVRTARGAPWTAGEFLRCARAVGASEEAASLAAAVGSGSGAASGAALWRRRPGPVR